MKTCLIVVISCLSMQLLAATPQVTDHVMGQNHVLNSTALQETVTLEIYQSENDQKNKPVLFVLDSQRHFPQAVAVQQYAVEFHKAPDFMVVGIRTTANSRSRWFYSQRQQFWTFFKNELIPYLEQHFDVGQERLLFGWEFAGGLIVSTMTREPDLFDAYITASPTPIYGSYFPQAKAELEAFEDQLKSDRLSDTFFYFSQSQHDFPVQYGMENLLKLKNAYPRQLQWSYRQWQHVTHPETAFPTLLDGIKSYYHNYPYLRISDIGLEKFLQSGGITTITPYYQSRSARFGFSEEETAKARKITHLSLTIQAISENNYPVFLDFINAFYGNIQALEDEHPNQVFNMAMFHLRHKQTDKSLEILDLLARKHPESPRPLNGKGDVYHAIGDLSKARSYYQKAVEMAKQNDHWRLQEFEMDLQKLETKNTPP